MYRPPDTTLGEFSAALKEIDEALLSLAEPTPTIAVMGDFNFPKSDVTWRREDGDLVPMVRGQRAVGPKEDGQKVREQCSRLCNLMLKHHLVQTVGGVTHWRRDPGITSDT